jgi:hypothetical protein
MKNAPASDETGAFPVSRLDTLELRVIRVRAA